jgi:hypothetical protein
LVEQHGQLIDELIRLESEVTGQPGGDRLHDAAEREVCAGFDAVVCRHAQRIAGKRARFGALPVQRPAVDVDRRIRTGRPLV